MHYRADHSVILSKLLIVLVKKVENKNVTSEISTVRGVNHPNEGEHAAVTQLPIKASLVTLSREHQIS